MNKRLLTEVEKRYIKQASALDHYAIVMLQIYEIDTEEVCFENLCTPEQLPERFADGVETGLHQFAELSGISGILVCIKDAVWREYDSSDGDFCMATLMALYDVFPREQWKTL